MRYLILIFTMVFCIKAAADEDSFDAYTIRPSDIPEHAPQFETYPARTKFKGPAAKPDVKSNSLSRIFRTVIRDGAKAGPNFAGHYTVIFWGCGTSCTSLAIADAKTGRVFHPKSLQSIDANNVDFDGFDYELVRFRLDSKLLVVFGGINEECARRGISYFLWDKDVLRRIRFVHKPYGVPCG